MLSELTDLLAVEFIVPGLITLIGSIVLSLAVAREVRKVIILIPMMMISLSYIGMSNNMFFFIPALISCGFFIFKDSAVTNTIMQTTHSIASAGKSASQFAFKATTGEADIMTRGGLKDALTGGWTARARGKAREEDSILGKIKEGWTQEKTEKRKKLEKEIAEKAEQAKLWDIANASAKAKRQGREKRRAKWKAKQDAYSGLRNMFLGGNKVNNKGNKINWEKANVRAKVELENRKRILRNIKRKFGVGIEDYGKGNEYVDRLLRKWKKKK